MFLSYSYVIFKVYFVVFSPSYEAFSAWFVLLSSSMVVFNDYLEALSSSEVVLNDSWVIFSYWELSLRDYLASLRDYSVVFNAYSFNLRAYSVVFMEIEVFWRDNSVALSVSWMLLTIYYTIFLSRSLFFSNTKFFLIYLFAASTFSSKPCTLFSSSIIWVADSVSWFVFALIYA